MSKNIVICRNCGHMGKGAVRGSIWVSLVLLILFFPAAIAYEIWRACGNGGQCRSCRKNDTVLADSPAGRKLQREFAEPV